MNPDLKKLPRCGCAEPGLISWRRYAWRARGHLLMRSVDVPLCGRCGGIASADPLPENPKPKPKEKGRSAKSAPKTAEQSKPKYPSKPVARKAFTVIQGGRAR